MAGVLTLWASPLLARRRLGEGGLRAGQQTTDDVRKLTNAMSVLDGGGSNVVAFSSADGIVLVDTGAPNNGGRVMARRS
jgi:hypothetical protein